jgi:hypothetical protein
MTRVVRSAPQYHARNPLVNHTITSVVIPLMLAVLPLCKRSWVRLLVYTPIPGILILLSLRNCAPTCIPQVQSIRYNIGRAVAMHLPSAIVILYWGAISSVTMANWPPGRGRSRQWVWLVLNRRIGCECQSDFVDGQFYWVILEAAFLAMWSDLPSRCSMASDTKCHWLACWPFFNDHSL